MALRILVALVAALTLWFGGDHFGHARGVNAQKAADQKELDRLNTEREEQKAEANDRYRRLVADNLSIINARDRAKLELETQHEKDRVATEQLRNRYAGVGLRFKPEQGSGYWSGSGSAQGQQPDAAGDAGPASVELPGSIAAGLRQIVYDADTLRDDYRLLYGWAHSDAVRCAVPESATTARSIEE